MRRLSLFVTLLLIMTAMLVLAGPASAQATGCQAFGRGLAAEAHRLGGLGQDVRAAAPVNDEVVIFKGLFCS